MYFEILLGYVLLFDDLNKFRQKQIGQTHVICTYKYNTMKGAKHGIHSFNTVAKFLQKVLIASTWFHVAGENIHNNLTRLVMGVWLFVVLILTSSYTASLSSMLTVQKLEPNYMELLKKNNLPVGCANLSVRKYLVNAFEFKEQNIKMLNRTMLFEQENIFAIFIESPYEEVFFKNNCGKDYTITRLLTHGFGGLGFVSIN